MSITIYLKSHDYHMITGLPISSNSHALIDAIGGMRDNVVQFIGHTSRSRYIGNTAHYKLFLWHAYLVLKSDNVHMHVHIAENFRQEKIFANFATWSCWRKFCSANILPCVNDT